MSNPFSVDQNLQTHQSRLEFSRAQKGPNEAVYQYVGRLKRLLDTVPGANLQDQIFMISSKLPNRFNHRLLQLTFASYEDYLIKVKAIEDEFKLEDEKRGHKKGGYQKNAQLNKQKNFNRQNTEKYKSTPNLSALGDQLGELSLSENISISINLNKNKGARKPLDTENSGSQTKNNHQFNNYKQQKNVQRNNFQKRDSQHYTATQQQHNLSTSIDHQKNRPMFNNNNNNNNNNRNNNNTFRKQNPNFILNKNFNQKNTSAPKLYPKLPPQQTEQPTSAYSSLPNSCFQVTLDNRIHTTATVDPSTMNSYLSSRLAAQLGLILPGTAPENFHLTDTRIPMRLHTTGDLYSIKLSINSGALNELTLGADFLRCYQN